MRILSETHHPQCRPVEANGRIVTKQVKAVTANMFACNQGLGAPLEDNGEASTRRSHWEATAYNGELLIGTAGSARGILSNVTLALAEDSGWYYANWANTNFLRYAHDTGCSLLLVRGRCLGFALLGLERSRVCRHFWACTCRCLHVKVCTNVCMWNDCM